MLTPGQVGPLMAEFSVGKRELFVSMLLAFFFVSFYVFVRFFMLRRQRQPILHLLFEVLEAVQSPIRICPNLGLTVQVYPEGLLRTHGGLIEGTRWNEISLVHRTLDASNLLRKFSPIRIRNLSLYTIDDQRLHLPGILPRFQELGQIVDTETLRYLLPAAWQGIEAGQTIPFEKLDLSKHGVHRGAETLPWKEIEKIVFAKDSGHLQIYRNTGMRWSDDFILDAPNVHALEALVERSFSNSNGYGRLTACRESLGDGLA